jgi:hypothetical protein
MTDSTTQNSGADSRAADGALIEALQEASFQGDAWDRFAGELARYALPIINSWIASLRIFAKCTEKGMGCPGPPHNIRLLSEDNASEMAHEIIARALNRFRDQVLRQGRWSPAHGATLSFMVITQCICQFPNVYRHWQIENEQTVTDQRIEEELEFMDPGPDDEPTGLIVAREEIAHALEHYVKDPRVEHGLLLKSWEYTSRESAEMLGVTKNALDVVLKRYWRTLRGRPDGLDGGGEEGMTAP